MKRFKKNQIIITALAVMIAVAGYINYSNNLKGTLPVNGEMQTDENGNPIDSASNDILSNDAEPDNGSEPGEAVFTGTDTVLSGVISNAKLNREQVRASNKETLLGIIEDKTLSEASKKDAVVKLAAITDNSEKEMAAELLLEAKGFTDVVVSLVDGSVDVVVGVTSLTDTQRAQIEDVVKRKTGVTADKISINICNN
ncbi:MAG: SpoIIIAH-like family protein [Lachnospira sp.]|nr:SpoIIIAH-like family protein [Lachnospira sp.]